MKHENPVQVFDKMAGKLPGLIRQQKAVTDKFERQNRR